MLSICEITKVAPCGFLATSQWVLPRKFPNILLHYSGGGGQMTASLGPRLSPFLREAERWTVERKGLSGPWWCFTSRRADHFKQRPFIGKTLDPKEDASGWIQLDKGILSKACLRGPHTGHPPWPRDVWEEEVLGGVGQGRLPEGLSVPTQPAAL